MARPSLMHLCERITSRRRRMMIVRLGGCSLEEAVVEGRAMMAQLGVWSWRRRARGARHAKPSGIEA